MPIRSMMSVAIRSLVIFGDPIALHFHSLDVYQVCDDCLAPVVRLSGRGLDLYTDLHMRALVHATIPSSVARTPRFCVAFAWISYPYCASVSRATSFQKSSSSMTTMRTAFLRAPALR